MIGIKDMNLFLHSQSIYTKFTLHSEEKKSTSGFLQRQIQKIATF